MLRMLKWLLFVILFCFLTSCTPSPPDVPVCEDLSQHLSKDPKSGDVVMVASPTCEAKIGEMQCGHCVFIVSGKEIFVGENTANFYNGKPWSVLKAQSVYLPAAESYAPLSAYVINSCKKMGCNSQVDAFKVKLDSLNGLVNVVKNL